MARCFGPILKLAAGHHGGEAAALKKSANAHAVKNLAKVPADRLLSVMTKCVFNAGFNWKVIEAAAFANDSKAFAGRNLKGNSPHGVYGAISGFEIYGEVFYGQDRHAQRVTS